MKKLLFFSAIFLTSTISYANNHPVNLAGKYNCQCTEVGTNKVYTGVMTVEKTGSTYAINSIFTDGSTYKATGIYDEARHIFSLVFVNPKVPKETGVAAALVDKNYAMSSTWTYLDETRVAHSTCTRMNKT